MAEQDDRKDEETPNAERRRFVTTLAAAVATAGVAGALTTGSKSRKSRILARIQEEMDGEYLNDPLTYHTGGYGEYVKA